jgi:hypothetical protein
MSYRSKLIAVFLFSFASSSYAETGTFENVHCYSGQPQTLKHSDANVVNMAMIAGTVRATSPGQIFDNMSTQCIGLFGQIEGGAFSQGFCEWSDADGDRLFFRYERKGTEGTFHDVSGTGKYQQLKVDATYVLRRFPSKPGMVQGCSENKGRWERP